MVSTRQGVKASLNTTPERERRAPGSRPSPARSKITTSAMFLRQQAWRALKQTHHSLRHGWRMSPCKPLRDRILRKYVNNSDSIIIIISMTFFLHHGEVVMSSQITIKQSSYTHLLAHIPGTCSVIFSSCARFTVYPNRIMLRHPTPLQVIFHQGTGWRFERTRAKQKWQYLTQS